MLMIDRYSRARSMLAKPFFADSFEERNARKKPRRISDRRPLVQKKSPVERSAC